MTLLLDKVVDRAEECVSENVAVGVLGRAGHCRRILDRGRGRRFIQPRGCGYVGVHATSNNHALAVGVGIVDLPS